MQQMHGITGKRDLIGDPVRISKSKFAGLVGLSPGRVSQLVKKGLPVEKDGKIDPALGRLWIAENVSPTRSAGQRSNGLPFAEERQQAGLTAERLRLAKEQADAAALRNAQLRGEMVKSADIEREWASMLRKIRAGVMAVPSRVRQQLPHLTPHDIALIETEIRDVLEGLSNDS